jgi:hypothetical protein
MISISRAGSMRCPVIIVGRFAFKFAPDARGRASNLYEAKLYRSVNATRRALLCPVIWVSRNGFLQIMSAAKPRADMMSLEDYAHVAEAWTTCRERIVAPSSQRRPTGNGSKAARSRSITRPRRGRPTNLLPLEAFERALPQQAFGSDIAILHVREEGRLDPRGLRLLDRLRQL